MPVSPEHLNQNERRRNSGIRNAHEIIYNTMSLMILRSISIKGNQNGNHEKHMFFIGCRLLPTIHQRARDRVLFSTHNTTQNSYRELEPQNPP